MVSRWFKSWQLWGFQIVNKVIPIRISVHEELLGADLAEHKIRHRDEKITFTFSQLVVFHPEIADLKNIQVIGSNPGQSSHFECQLKWVFCFIPNEKLQIGVHSTLSLIWMSRCLTAYVAFTK